MRALRGAGPVGLAGIPARRGRYVRPLLGVTRGDVIDFLQAIGQRWLVDPTNSSLVVLRNRVRHELLPAIELAVPGAGRALARLADAARSDRDALEYFATEHLRENGLEIGALRKAHPGLFAHVVRLSAGVAISHERLQALRRLVQTGAGTVEIEGGVSARIERGGELPPLSEVRVLVFRSSRVATRHSPD